MRRKASPEDRWPKTWDGWTYEQIIRESAIRFGGSHAPRATDDQYRAALQTAERAKDEGFIRQPKRQPKIKKPTKRELRDAQQPSLF